LIILLLACLPLVFFLVIILRKSFPAEIGYENPEFYIIFTLFMTYVIFNFILNLSIAIITEKVIDQKDVSWLSAIKDASSKWGRALLTIILTSLILLGLSLLLVIPGFIYSVYYTFIMPVIALRGFFGKEALDYSKKLVEGQWWRVFGIQIVLSIILGIISMVINVPIGLISEKFHAVNFSNAASYFLGSLIGIAFSIMNTVLFLNNEFVYNNRLAKRKEMEKLRKTKKIQHTEPIVENAKQEEPESSKQSPAKKVVRKSATKANTTTIAKKVVRKSATKANTTTIAKKVVRKSATKANTTTIAKKTSYSRQGLNFSYCQRLRYV
jgi:hypothetical protein